MPLASSALQADVLYFIVRACFGTPFSCINGTHRRLLCLRRQRQVFLNPSKIYVLNSFSKNTYTEVYTPSSAFSGQLAGIAYIGGEWQRTA